MRADERAFQQGMRGLRDLGGSKGDVILLGDRGGGSTYSPAILLLDGRKVELVLVRFDEIFWRRDGLETM